jgi:mRNA-degrading endonuclease RelE of RelBE toxin-antitoxin system
LHGIVLFIGIPPNRWGIYILDKGLYYIAKNVFGEIGLISPYGRHYNMLDLLQESFRLLFLHEFFHYITDIAASTLEMGNPSARQYYVQYIRNVYMHSRNRDEPIEEALANAFTYNRFYGWAVRTQLRLFMRNQPAGYSAFEQYTRKNNFTYGRRELGTCIRDGTHASGVPPLETLFDCYRRDINFGDVPIYIVPTITDPRYLIRLIISIHQSALIQSTAFRRDLQQLPHDVVEKYQKALRMLEYSVRHRGLKFEKIKGCDTVFTVRIDRKYRLSMRPLNGNWELLRIAEHDEVYRNPGV